MGTQYYYLVSSLPDIGLDDGRTPPPFLATLSGIEDNVTESDRALFSLFRRPYDNRNLITLLTGRAFEFHPFGTYSRADLENEIRSPVSLPDYMQELIDAYRDKKNLFPGLNIEDQLDWLFYDGMTTHPNSFIRDFFAQDLHLRNIASALNGRRSKTPPVLLGQNEVTDALSRSSAPDFGLSGTFPWAESLFSIDITQSIEFEKKLDSTRWNIAEELCALSFFGVETLLSFSVRLSISIRWHDMTSDKGKERFDAVLETMLNQLPSLSSY
ncbi:MAG: hypothetical protein A2293_03650 [Elusimicrobia bacterium RIFOXYB2_FULL_49_7]|nr:MAG: hypothetical protein A2293_03650 [Elusimicrobia bacterium RIFOXYB2_FULL_49_7]